MANIRIKDLPADGAPNQNDVIPIDLSGTRGATVKAVVESGRPTASKTDAEAGVDPQKAMTPLTTKQAIDAQVSASYVPKTVKVNAGSGMTGGGELSGDVTVGLTVDNIDRLNKVDGIEVGATKNETDAYLLARANHTGTQAISTVNGLQGALDGKATSSQGAKADTALQAPGGTTGQVLAKASADDNDVSWITSEAATAVSYGPQTLTEPQKTQARANIDADKVYNSVSDVQSSVINSSVMAIRTNGYSSSGDGGGALYKRVAVEPSHAGKVQSADGSWWEISEVSYNVKQFGAKGDGVTDDTQPFLNIRDFFQTPSAYRGGVINIPKGVYKITNTLSFSMYDPELVINIYLKGDGQQTTVLDFSDAPAGTDGVYFGKGAHFGAENFSIANARRDGLVLKGGERGVDDFNQQGCIRNIRISFPVRHGLLVENCFMTEISNVWAMHAGDTGMMLYGFSTSLNVNRCWSSNSANAGWIINGVIYSTFNACGSDENLYGYAVSNVRGVAFNGCGAESNLRDAWILLTGNTASSDMPPEAQDIHGLSFTGCYGFRNGLQSPGTYANLVAALSADGRPIDVLISACNTEKASSSDPSVSVNGASGLIKVTEQSCKFDGNVFTSGNVIYEGRRFTFTPTVAGSSSAGSCSYTIRNGSYIINSGLLSVDVDVQWSGHTGSGGLFVSGMPIEPQGVAIFTVTPYGLVFDKMVSSVMAASTTAEVLNIPSGGSPSYVDLPANGRVILSGSYNVSGY